MKARILNIGTILALTLSMGVAGFGSARAPAEEIEMPVLEPSTVQLDAEIEALFAELGGSSDPDASACCRATCLTSSCTACCSAGSVPVCSCTLLGGASCRCEDVEETVQRVIDLITGGDG